MSRLAFLKSFLDKEVYVIDKQLGEKPLTKIPEEASEQVDEAVVKYGDIHYKGDNAKKLVILVHDQSSEYIDTADELFLMKILGALRYSITDVAIINLAHHPDLTVNQLLALPCKKCLIFADASPLIKAKNNVPTETDTILFLQSLPLKNLIRDVDEKKKLWLALQNMFNSN